MRRLAAVAVLAGLPACAVPPPPPPALTAEVRQYRSDVPLRMMSATVTNGGSAAVLIERVQLVAPGFIALPSVDVDIEVPGGSRVDVPVSYGLARCSSPPPEGAAVVRTRVRGAGEVVVHLSPAGGLLDRLHASECAQAAVRAAVSIELGPGWVRRGGRLEGTLVVQRRSGDLPVEVREPGGHIVFTVRGELPAVLAAGQQHLTVPLRVTPTRCDGHALSQNSRSAVFPFVLAVGDGEPVQVPAAAGPELQVQLQELAIDVCVPAS
jgi:hypothetical protein